MQIDDWVSTAVVTLDCSDVTFSDPRKDSVNPQQDEKPFSMSCTSLKMPSISEGKVLFL
uniref:Uncharacterized protein n=1 Tax=Rhizophora mucronata TaxID=61149 RepID=A0A2P2PTL4_RHIMU